MSREDPQMKLRLSPALKTRLEHAVARSVRSLNAEVVQRLEASFAPQPRRVEAEGLLLDMLRAHRMLDRLNVPSAENEQELTLAERMERLLANMTPQRKRASP